MSDILAEAKRLGVIKDDSLDKLGALDSLLTNVISQKAWREDNCENTALHKIITDEIREEVRKEAGKLRGD